MKLTQVLFGFVMLIFMLFLGWYGGLDYFKRSIDNVMWLLMSFFIVGSIIAILQK